MKSEFFRHDRRTYRYVLMKGVNNAIPAISVIMTAQFGILAGALTLSFQLVMGAFTDLSFFNALVHTNGKGKTNGP